MSFQYFPMEGPGPERSFHYGYRDTDRVHPDAYDETTRFNTSNYDVPMDNTQNNNCDDKGTVGGSSWSMVDKPELVSEDEQLETKLHQYARTGDFGKAATYLQIEKNKDNINKTDTHEEMTALHYAARYDRRDMVKLLIDNGADAICKDKYGRLPLHLACTRKRKRSDPREITPVQAGRGQDHVAVRHTGRFQPAFHGPKPGRLTHVTLPPLVSDSCSFQHSPYFQAGDQDSLLGEFPMTPLNPEVPVPKAEETMPTIEQLVTAIQLLDPKDHSRQTPLHHAAIRGDEVAVEQLLNITLTKVTNDDRKGRIINAKDTQNMTPLHFAATHNHPHIVWMLVCAGALMNIRSHTNSSPIHAAAKAGSVDAAGVMFEFIQRQPNSWINVTQLLRAVDKDGDTPLILAAAAGRYEFVRLCLDRASSEGGSICELVRATNKAGHTPLHVAAQNGDEKIVELLIQYGAKVDARTKKKYTPLHEAAKHNKDKNANLEARTMNNFTPLLLAIHEGHDSTVQLLLDRHADINAEDTQERTVLHLAVHSETLDVLKVLLKTDAKAKINEKDQNGEGPLHLAASRGEDDMWKCLLEHGAEVNSKDQREQSPIHKATKADSYDIVSEILERTEQNAVFDRDEDSNTALHLAAMEGHVDLVEQLLDAGAEVDSVNSSSRTPLACAVANGHTRTVEKLMEYDPDIHCKDKSQMTPLMIAAQHGYAKLAGILLDNGADVKMRDGKGRNCLDYAIDNDNQEVTMKIIESDDWKDALKNSYKKRNGYIETPMRKLIRTMPVVAFEVFDRCIKIEKMDEGGLWEKCEVTYNYQFLDDTYNVCDWGEKDRNASKNKWKPYTSRLSIFKQNHPLMVMVTSNQQELLDHELVERLIDYKWNRFGIWALLLNVMLYGLFIALLTMYVSQTTAPYLITDASLAGYSGDTVCERYQESGAREQPQALFAKISLFVLTSIHIVKEVFQMYQWRRKYLTFDNLLEVSMLLSTALFLVDFNGCRNDTGYKLEWQFLFGTVAIVLAWINVVLFLQRVPGVGIYVLLLQRVIHRFFEFFFVYAFLVVGFGLGFYNLVRNQAAFNNVGKAIVKTSVMMLGEIDYNTLFHDNTVPYVEATYALFMAFFVFIAIILSNLMTGIAVDDTKAIMEGEVLTRIAMTVSLVLDVEKFIMRFRGKECCGGYETFVKKEKVEMSIDRASTNTRKAKELNDPVHRSQQEILKVVSKMRSEFTDLQETLENLEETLDGIAKERKGLSSSSVDNLQWD